MKKVLAFFTFVMSAVSLNAQNVNIGTVSANVGFFVLLFSLLGVSFVFMLLSNVYIFHFKSKNYVIISFVTTLILIFFTAINPIAGILCFFATFFALISFMGSTSHKNYTAQIGGSVAYYICFILCIFYMFF